MKDVAPQSTAERKKHFAAGTDLPLDRYAEVIATVLHYRPEQAAEVIARFGLSDEAWEAAEKSWLEVLACRGNRTDGAIALEFTSTFARTRTRLGLAKPRIAKIGPLPAASPAVLALPSHVPAPPEPPRTAEVPSYLREQTPAPVPDRVSPPPPPYAATMSLPIMRPDEMIAPPIPAQPSPIFAPVPSEDEDEDVSETAEVDVRCFRAALPFSNTRTKPGAEGAAVPPPGKRLIRFDPQTGEPLSSPRWADVPVVDGMEAPASVTAMPRQDQLTGHETAVLPVLPLLASLPFPVADAPPAGARPPWKPG